MRQVAVIDAQGRVATHTGDRCIAHAAHVIGSDHSCQANMMLNATVPAAMSNAFEAASGTLAERLMAALEAAQGEGGDVRGSQSAAMIVVPAEGEPWRRTVDLRVEDHPEPLAELRRLLVLRCAYELADEADALLAAGRTDEAGERYRRAGELAPDSQELRFWAGLATAQVGDVDAGAAMVRRVIEVDPNWRALLDRLQPDFAPAAEAVRRALG